MAGQMASLFTQCCQHVHFFCDHPHTSFMVIHETKHMLFISELLHKEGILFLQICDALLSGKF
jgi:hypothetical protein